MNRVSYSENQFTSLLLERLATKVAKLVLLSCALAWLLTCIHHSICQIPLLVSLGTSREVMSNIPLATVSIFFLHWLSTRLIFHSSGKESSSSSKRRYSNFHKPVRSDFCYKEKMKDPPDRDAWRARVGAPIVAAAWESFCGSIIQEWIYDSWYCMLSPDREFPAEVRRVLNESFASLAQRAKKIDLRTLLIRYS